MHSLLNPEVLISYFKGYLLSVFGNSYRNVLEKGNCAIYSLENEECMVLKKKKTGKRRFTLKVNYQQRFLTNYTDTTRHEDKISFILVHESKS